jgi:hypothetical protein
MAKIRQNLKKLVKIRHNLGPAAIQLPYNLRDVNSIVATIK